MSILFAITTYALAIAGHFLSYAVDKKKRKTLYWSLFVLWLALFSAVFLGEQSSSRGEAELATARHDSLIARYDSLQSTSGELRTSYESSAVKLDSQLVVISVLKRTQDSLVILLNPFREMAHVYSPASDDHTALAVLANDMRKVLKGVSALQPTLRLLPEKTRQVLDQVVGLYRTTIVFRSQGATLRDVGIYARFRDVIVGATGYIQGGAIHMESGTRMTIHDDNKGFTFITGELIPSNDIVVEIRSRSLPELVELRTSP